MKRIDEELALEAAARLQDWIPLSDARALTWATDLLEASPDEPLVKTARRINEAARSAARATRDVRYHDVFESFTKLLKRDIEKEEAGDLETPALTAMTGDPDHNKLASSSVISDMLDGLIKGDEVEAEIERRRRMTAAEIKNHRSELLSQRPLPKLPFGPKSRGSA